MKRRKDKRQIDIDKERGWKICKLCDKTKTLDNFTEDKSKCSSFFIRCKSCMLKIKKQRHEEKIEKYGKNYLDHIKLIERRSYLKHKKKRDLSATNYRKSKEGREFYRNYKRNKRKNNINYKLYTICGKRMRNSLKSSGNIKNEKTIDLLGCEPTKLKSYLESLFKPGMTWENHGVGKGKWNLEHILPCILFDMSDEKQRKICFNYKNISPEWHEINLIKSDFLPDGRRARDLSLEEKLDYLRNLGYDL